MPESAKSPGDLGQENQRLRAQVALLEDRIDHITGEDGAAAAGKDAARALAELHELHHAAQRAMSDVVLVTDDAGRLTYVPPNVHLIFGHSQQDVERHGRIGFLLPAELFDRDVLESRGEIANLECRIRDSVGRARELLVTIRRVRLGNGTVLFVCRDVTERKRIESELRLLQLSLDRKVEERTQELRESRESYRRLVEGLRDEYFFYASDPYGTLTYVSPSIHSILGYTPDEVVGRNWREFVVPASKSYAYIEDLERQRFAGLPTPPFEAEVRHANGEIRYLQNRDTPLRNMDGRVIANEGIARDITEKRKNEEELRRSREELEQRVAERTAELQAMYERLQDSETRYRNVVEDNPDFIVRWEGDGVRTFVNESYCRYVNMSRDELIGTSFLPGILEEDRERLESRLRAVTPDEPLVVSEHRATLPDGRVAWQRWSNRALFDHDGNLLEFQAVGSDVTDRRVAEEHAREKAVAETQLRNLTPREHDVMRLVVVGDANKVIARKLDLSIKTIEKHRSSLMRKLRVRSVPELVRLALLAEPEIETDR